MSREWRMYWNDMRHAADKIVAYTQGVDATAFAGNDLIRDAVLRNLEVIGEAAKHVPPEIREKVTALD